MMTVVSAASGQRRGENVRMKILRGGGLLLGVALAQATPLAGYELPLALQRLAESTMPVQVFRERVAALTAG